MHMGISFILLNIIDAYLTNEALGMGAVELNPIGMFWGNMVVKGLIAVAIVAGLCFCKEEKLLLPLSVGMLGICFWNFAMCFMGAAANAFS